MANPAKRLLDGCRYGYRLSQKLGYTALGLLYIVSPIDVIPDLIVLFGQCDDFFVIYLLIRIWMSPTLPRYWQPAPESRFEGGERLQAPNERANIGQNFEAHSTRGYCGGGAGADNQEPGEPAEIDRQHQFTRHAAPNPMPSSRGQV